MMVGSAQSPEAKSVVDVEEISTTADHVSEARRRARDVLSCESHLGDVDDWRHVTVTARDGVVLVFLIWVAMHAHGVVQGVGEVLVCAGLGIALYQAIATSIATRLRLRYLESELDRERRELRDDPAHEREEVRALYAAKGFRGPLLTQVVDVLCADDDRLLKVMMEEELGLFVQHVNHPLLVGLWNGVGGAVGVLLLALPVCVQEPSTTLVWMPMGAAVILLLVAVATSRLTRRAMIPMYVTWLIGAGVAAGVTHFLAQLML